MRRMQWQLGNWEASENLLQDREQSRQPVPRWPVTGPFGC